MRCYRWLKQLFKNKCTKKGSNVHPDIEDNALAQEYFLYKTEDFTMSEYTEKSQLRIHLDATILNLALA